MAGEYRFHFLSRVLRDEIIDRVKDHRHVPRHLAQCREPRVIGEGIASDRPQQALRGFRAPCRNGQPHPIGRSEHPPRSKVHRLAQPIASRREVSASQCGNRIVHQPKQRLEHRKIDDLTACNALFASK